MSGVGCRVYVASRGEMKLLDKRPARNLSGQPSLPPCLSLPPRLPASLPQHLPSHTCAPTYQTRLPTTLSLVVSLLQSSMKHEPLNRKGTWWSATSQEKHEPLQRFSLGESRKNTNPSSCESQTTHSKHEPLKLRGLCSVWFNLRKSEHEPLNLRGSCSVWFKAGNLPVVSWRNTSLRRCKGETRASKSG